MSGTMSDENSQDISENDSQDAPAIDDNQHQDPNADNSKSNNATPHDSINQKNKPNGDVEEVWVENDACDGKVYYYNARSRESSWTKPEGPSVRILSQKEIERIAALKKQQQAPEKKEEAEKPQEQKAIEQSTAAVAIPRPLPGSFPPPFFPGFPPGFPPPSFGMNPAGILPFPPPFGMMPPPPFAHPLLAHTFQHQLAIEEKMKEYKGHYDDETLKQIRECEERLAKSKFDASTVNEYETPDGKKYYYNSKSGESVWEKPKCLLDLAEIPARLEALKKKRIEKKFEDMTEEEKAKARSKPMSSTPVPGTPWCVVWTRDSKVFFYNPSEKVSSWERPAILKGRTDVDKMVSESPSDSPLIEQVKKRLHTEEAAKTAADVVGTANEPPQKKVKPIEEPTNVSLQEALHADENSNESTASRKSTKETAIEADFKASKERTQIPLEQRIKQFREMLAEKEVSAFSTWEKELHKIVFDPRYLLLTSKERKQVFEKYIKERAEDERKEKAVILKKRKDDFRELFKEANVGQRSLFSEFSARHGKDERFKAIEKLKERESLFNDYKSELRNREKEDKHGDKDRLKRDFIAMLKEIKELNKNSSWSETKKMIDDDSRYRAVESSARREDWFRDYVRHLDENSMDSDAKEEQRKEKERQERIECSIKEREKMVKEQLSKINREREKGRDQLRRDEALECFKVLLIDLVKQSDLTWKEAKKVLKKDSRYDFCEDLPKDYREKLFEEHVEALRSRKKEQFYAMLDEVQMGETKIATGVPLNATWKDVKKLIKNDVRYEKLSQVSDIKLEKEFENYIRKRHEKAKNDFKELLADAKIISYKSLSMIKESPLHLKDIEDFLSKDKCWIVLDCAPEERDKMTMDYLVQLERQGAPPPPTASSAADTQRSSKQPQLSSN